MERKEKLIRILQLLETTDSKSPINATAIVDRLKNEYTVGDVDRRAVYRDIDMLIGCGYAIKQCHDKRLGWYMDSHPFEDWELKLMMDAVQQARCISLSDASGIREKLLTLTSKRGRTRFTHLIMPKSENKDQDESVGEYIETMLEAMFQGKKIEFQYTEMSNDMSRVIKGNGKIYKLSLYTIYWSNNNYYMIGAHDNHDGLTNYRLDRIANIKISSEDAIEAKDKVGVNPEKYIQEYIELSVNHFSGSKIKVEIEYEPTPAINNILYDFTDGDIYVYEHKDGHCRAVFEKSDSVTLTGWLMQYSGKIKVISPEKLKKEICDKIKEASQIYQC
jgi:predicted DNA-binding transcriptional regulator YafY